MRAAVSGAECTQAASDGTGAPLKAWGLFKRREAWLGSYGVDATGQASGGCPGGDQWV